MSENKNAFCKNYCDEYWVPKKNVQDNLTHFGNLSLRKEPKEGKVLSSTSGSRHSNPAEN
jgi:hypothetical protein